METFKQRSSVLIEKKYLSGKGEGRRRKDDRERGRDRKKLAKIYLLLPFPYYLPEIIYFYSQILSLFGPQEYSLPFFHR